MSDDINPIKHRTVAAGGRAGATVIRNQAARIPHRCQTNTNLAVNSSPLAGRLALSMAEAADTLGISESSIRRLCRRGILKHSKALRHRRIAVEEIHRYLRDTAQ
jgi:excisionase family DNA binding protein